MTKRYFNNELKHSKRFDHVINDIKSFFGYKKIIR